MIQEEQVELSFMSINSNLNEKTHPNLKSLGGENRIVRFLEGKVPTAASETEALARAVNAHARGFVSVNEPLLGEFSSSLLSASPLRPTPHPQQDCGSAR